MNDKQKGFAIVIIIVVAILLSSVAFTDDVFQAIQVIVNKVTIVPTKLPVIEVKDYISPNNGIPLLEARKLIIDKLVSQGYKGDVNPAVINEITVKEAWENSGIQIFRFKVTWYDQVAVIKDNTVVSILSGPILSIFLADLDNDNIYEIYINDSQGSGIVSKEIHGYNIAFNEHYELSKRMKQDFFLFIDDSKLKVKVYPYRDFDDQKVIIAELVLKVSGDKKSLIYNK